ncbi:MAG: leucyl/phenylalanyl-tRNA--protein transferase, partial [Muribaculaceae bacterium]|nr:leucyl/phenylalanyl-tRNA--protein transferase [Muribaculaceae bacterium]
MVFQLSDELIFPDPYLGEEDGLLAVGGDYSTERLLLAYSNGIFPWSAFRNEQKLWFCPLNRFVIFPHEIHISHSMRSLIRKQRYDV